MFLDIDSSDNYFLAMPTDVDSDFSQLGLMKFDSTYDPEYYRGFDDA
jgi:hypothetical protein